MFSQTGISKCCLLNVSFTKLLKPTGKFLSVLLFPVSSLTSLVLFFSLPAMLRNYAWIKRLFFPFICQVLKQFILLKQALCKLYFHMKLPQLCALHPNHWMHLYTKLPSLQRTAITRQAKWTCTAQLKGSPVPKLHLAMGRFGFSWWNRSQISLVTKELLFIQHMQHRQQRGWLPLPHLKVAFGGNCL